MPEVGFLAFDTEPRIHSCSLPALCRLAWVQELIVSAAVLGAGIGSAVGGWFSDRLVRKQVLLVGDVFFTAGALLMAAASTANALIAGQVFKSIAALHTIPIACLQTLLDKHSLLSTHARGLTAPHASLESARSADSMQGWHAA